MTYNYVQYLEKKLFEARDSRKTVRTELQIEIAMASLLQTRAYHSISVDMITERARLAHGTFYRYFAGKRELVAKTLADYFEFVRTTRPKSSPETADYEAISIGNRHYVRCFRENVGLMRCHFHLKDEDDLIAEVARRADRQMSDRSIRRVLRKSQLTEDELHELRLTTYALISMVDELLLKVYGQMNPPLANLADQPDVVADTLTRLWHAALDGYGQKMSVETASPTEHRIDIAGE